MDEKFVEQQSTRRRPVRKVKFEETHQRATVWIRNDLMDLLDDWAKAGGHGEKTRVINEALEEFFKKNA